MSYPYGPPQPGYYPPAYPPPYPPSYQGYPPAPPMPPGRSAIPRVIGIIAIVFSALGLLINVAMYAGMRDDARQFEVFDELGFYGTWISLSFVFGFLVFALHLAGGIAATAYKRAAPMLITAYGIAALLSVAGDLLVVMLAFPEAARAYYDDLGMARIGLAVIALPWPIVALVLMNLRGAKVACGAAPAEEPAGSPSPRPYAAPPST